MATVGTLGDIVFEVSDDKILTFYDYGRKTSARFSSHEIIGKKPKLEFIGQAIDEISFTIKLSAYKGINPKEQAEKIREMIENGEVVRFIMAGLPIGKNKWVIESMNEKANFHNSIGQIVSADVELSLREYVEQEEQQ